MGQIREYGNFSPGAVEFLTRKGITLRPLSEYIGAETTDDVREAIQIAAGLNPQMREMADREFVLFRIMDDLYVGVVGKNWEMPADWLGEEMETPDGPLVIGYVH